MVRIEKEHVSTMSKEVEKLSSVEKKPNGFSRKKLVKIMKNCKVKLNMDAKI